MVLALRWRSPLLRIWGLEGRGRDAVGIGWKGMFICIAIFLVGFCWFWYWCFERLSRGFWDVTGIVYEQFDFFFTKCKLKIALRLWIVANHKVDGCGKLHDHGIVRYINLWTVWRWFILKSAPFMSFRERDRDNMLIVSLSTCHNSFKVYVNSSSNLLYHWPWSRSFEDFIKHPSILSICKACHRPDPQLHLCSY